MTYNVFSGTLNPTQLNSFQRYPVMSNRVNDLDCMLPMSTCKRQDKLCIYSYGKVHKDHSAAKTYPTLATFAWRLIKIYSVWYYIILNMCCINFFPQFLPLPTVIPLKRTHNKQLPDS